MALTFPTVARIIESPFAFPWATPSGEISATAEFKALQVTQVPRTFPLISKTLAVNTTVPSILVSPKGGSTSILAAMPSSDARIRMLPIGRRPDLVARIPGGIPSCSCAEIHLAGQ